MKKFAFLIQARSDSDYFKKFQSDDSDCYVLFFKTEITRERTFFRPNTTWTEGRNILLQKAFAQQDYEYYVFLDDDVRIINKSNSSCGIENFKKYLLEYQPAVGYMNYKNDYNKIKDFIDTYLPFLFWGRRTMANLLDLLFPEFHRGTSRIGYFDACANAIHKDVKVQA